jgi:hypothetical protein
MASAYPPRPTGKRRAGRPLLSVAGRPERAAPGRESSSMWIPSGFAELEAFTAILDEAGVEYR